MRSMMLLVMLPLMSAVVRRMRGLSGVAHEVGVVNDSAMSLIVSVMHMVRVQSIARVV